MHGVTETAGTGRVDDMQGVLTAEVARRLLQYHLVRLRGVAGKSQTEAAARIDRKQPTIAAMEAGKSLPIQTNLEVLLTFYGAAEMFPLMRDLLTVARTDATEGEAGITSTVNDFTLAVGLEPYAGKIDCWQPSVVVGLLQTEEYARTLIQYHADRHPGVDVEKAVWLRMQRQAAVMREKDPVELWFFAEERAFRRPVGGPKVHLAQIDHLLKCTERRNIKIMMMEDSVGEHSALSGAFYLLAFQDGLRVAYEETARSAYYYDATDSVDSYSRTVDHLRVETLSPEKTVAALRSIRKDITR